ncbi:endonuclease/exonuclease/phosphatase family protein [Calycomorphotria hydatis]|uniref:Endonuclease/exonuclease/phosphatase domain-containing protein n=1 Tax=Calycomorphotria hydatis TaxID=2528027 RepID=A0A517T8E8_9PLAN|nr:endonuclease/exonuclease/phosphatase family protein [Calycomorphotria hydatis]QDT64627.1 hypothetical protein V22_18670 [Calycomorphotria hydatis]
MKLRAANYSTGFALLCLAALIALVIADGADRDAADLSQPLRFTPVPTANAFSNDATSFRLVSFNIHYGHDDVDSARLPKITELVSSTQPDIVVLNEVKASPRMSRSLAEQLEMGHVFIPAETRWWQANVGNALLTRFHHPLLHPSHLPNTQGKAFRNVTLASFEFGGETVQLLATHADTHADNVEHLQMLTELFLNLQAPCILAGDLNAWIDQPSLQRILAAGGVDALIEHHPGEAADRMIDHIFVRGLTVDDANIIETPHSDHPLLWADLSLPVEEQSAE